MSAPPPGPPPSPPKSRRFRLGRVLAALAVLTGLPGLWLWRLSMPVSRAPRDVGITLRRGSAFTIGSQLHESGLIRSPLLFFAAARQSGRATKLKAGKYVLSPHLTLAQILQTLEAGPPGSQEDTTRVTIPEGYTLRQIADLLDARGVTNGPKLLALATSPKAFALLRPGFPLPPKTLEGYLFPDTYEFRPGAPPEKVLRALLLNFGAKFARPYQQDVAQSGETLHALVTKASLVEREARAAQDRARIAGVLDNRLERAMRLQIDATVLYALGEHKDRVLYRDLEVDSPYNTYRNKGLPPGPIASPGLAALEAALRPEAHSFLYYVARPDGSHLFTRTLAEHERAKRQARRERAAQGEPRG